MRVHVIEPILIIDAKRRTNLLKYSRELIFIRCKAEIHFFSVHAKGIGMYYLYGSPMGD